MVLDFLKPSWVNRQETLKHFLSKRDNGELMIQKNSEFLSTLNKKIEISISQDYSLHIGDQVMVLCPAPDPGDPNNTWPDNPRGDMVVAAHITSPADLLLGRQSTEPLLATATRTLEPNQRTVFSIESVEGGMKGYKVKHGEPFYLRLVSQTLGQLYLCSDRVAFNKRAVKSKHQLVFFSPHPSYLGHWMLVHKNPRLRLEYEHLPVEANEKCALVHCKTNNCLAVEDFGVHTPFGRELEVAAHTYLDSHRVEKDNNQWVLLLAVPGSRAQPVPYQPPLPR
ncbi:cilia- and flagella-associated protein 161-like [Babylonia areolata]|uniref:cilia- and flagella-associated protein 161-like n=1 Tax=Babylonia areolata TaxID=304850 RepID=UPI003FD58399